MLLVGALEPQLLGTSALGHYLLQMLPCEVTSFMKVQDVVVPRNGQRPSLNFKICFG